MYGSALLSSPICQYLSKLLKRSSLPGFHDSKTNGPVPIGLSIVPSGLNDSGARIAPQAFWVSWLGNEPKPLVMATWNVYGSTTLETTPRSLKIGASRAPLFSSAIRSKFNLTTSAVSSRPLWNVTPLRMWKTHVLPASGSLEFLGQHRRHFVLRVTADQRLAEQRTHDAVTQTGRLGGIDTRDILRYRDGQRATSADRAAGSRWLRGHGRFRSAGAVVGAAAAGAVVGAAAAAGRCLRRRCRSRREQRPGRTRPAHPAAPSGP